MKIIFNNNRAVWAALALERFISRSTERSHHQYLLSKRTAKGDVFNVKSVKSDVTQRELACQLTTTRQAATPASKPHSHGAASVAAMTSLMVSVCKNFSTASQRSDIQCQAVCVISAQTTRCAIDARGR